MIKVTVGNNLTRKTVTIDPSMTIRRLLEEQQISGGVLTLDGCYLEHSDLDRSFADYGVTESAVLLSIVKADNA